MCIRFQSAPIGETELWVDVGSGEEEERQEETKKQERKRPCHTEEPDGSKVTMAKRADATIRVKAKLHKASRENLD